MGVFDFAKNFFQSTGQLKLEFELPYTEKPWEVVIVLTYTSVCLPLFLPPPPLLLFLQQLRAIGGKDLKGKWKGEYFPKVFVNAK